MERLEPSDDSKMSLPSLFPSFSDAHKHNFTVDHFTTVLANELNKMKDLHFKNLKKYKSSWNIRLKPLPDNQNSNNMDICETGVTLSSVGVEKGIIFDKKFFS